MDSRENSHYTGTDPAVSGISGAVLIPFALATILVLSLLSIPQKILLGADWRDPAGYVVPVLFGGGVGLCIGYLFRRSRLRFRDRLRQQARSAARLAESEERLRMLADNARDTIFSWSLKEGRYTYLSPAVHDLTGYLAQDFMADPGLFLTLIHPEDRQAVQEVAERVHEARLPAETDYRVIHKSGREVFVNQRHTVALDSEGRPVALEGLCTDVTAHVRARQERERIQGELLQAQKMEAIGNLASGISHDFNNLLTVINGYAELLLELHADDDAGARELEAILKAGRKASELTTQLLTFSRKQITRPRLVELDTATRETLQMMRRVLGSDIHLEHDIPADLPRVYIDTVQMDQVLMNLVINAQDAMPRGGTLTIRAREHRFDGEICIPCGESITGHMVVLEISDTGNGMDEQTRVRVFDPFFTTKEPGKGSGLGLSTVFGIIHQNEGHVSVTSEVGLGSVFRVILPARTDDPAAVEPVVDAGTVHRGSETVLLVEDESLVRSLAAAILEQYGYSVLLAEDGPAALDLFRDADPAVDLVLTDLIMPRMSGVDLAARLRARAPNLPLIFMSGYLDAKVDLGAFADAPYLQKPFGAEGLARLVRQVLDGGPAA